MHATGVRILELLPNTRAGLRAELGVGKATMHKWLTRLESMGLLHVGGWRRTLGDMAGVYHLGTGRTPPRPKPYTPAAVSQRYRNSLKELGLYEDMLADMRKWRARNRPRVNDYKKQDLMAWIPRRTTTPTNGEAS